MAHQIAIQGYEGSFHHIAALHLLGTENSVLPCKTFREVVALAADGEQVTGGLMAIENSIAGSILPNYTLLQRSELVISGEVYLEINQNLLTLPDADISGLTEVRSHPMALLQCIDFLETLPVTLVETDDTALSALELAKTKEPNVGVVASDLAARLYGLTIAAPAVQSQKNNYTRFLFVQKRTSSATNMDADKASVNFSTDHQKGSLAKVLTTIADTGINLSKLQSMPIPEKQWQYSFHADLEFDDRKQLDEALSSIRPLTNRLSILGVYKKGRTVL